MGAVGRWHTGVRVGGIADVLALSPRDVWAVGWLRISNGLPAARALVLHWDGRRWQDVPLPGHLILTALAGRPLEGDLGDRNHPRGPAERGTRRIKGGLQDGRFLFARWNGRRWEVVLGPHARTFSDRPHDLAVVSRNDVVAVGGTSHVLVLRWNGQRWSRDQAPAGVEELYAVDAGAGQSWAIGYGSGTNALEFVIVRCTR